MRTLTFQLIACAVAVVGAAWATGAPAAPIEAAMLSRGARVYRTVCLACHMPDGRGVPAVTPPLVDADFLLSDRDRAVRIVLDGLTGPIVVNGVRYEGEMPPLEAALSDRQIADVLTFVFNSWGNQGAAFTADEVAAMRARPR